MKRVYFIVAAVFTLAACNKKESTSTVAAESTDTTAVAPAPNDSASVKVNSSVAPVSTAAPQTVNVTPQVVASAQQAPVSAPGMNPPHGQPNHRCDIPVGAPLSTPPQNTAQQNIVPQTVLPAPTQNNMAPQAVQTTTPVATAPGMNPPHGQAGHRCDIPVGAPLNQ